MLRCENTFPTMSSETKLFLCVTRTPDARPYIFPQYATDLRDAIRAYAARSNLTLTGDMCCRGLSYTTVSNHIKYLPTMISNTMEKEQIMAFRLGNNGLNLDVVTSPTSFPEPPISQD